MDSESEETGKGSRETEDRFHRVIREEQTGQSRTRDAQIDERQSARTNQWTRTRTQSTESKHTERQRKILFQIDHQDQFDEHSQRYDTEVNFLLESIVFWSSHSDRSTSFSSNESIRRDRQTSNESSTGNVVENIREGFILLRLARTRIESIASRQSRETEQREKSPGRNSTSAIDTSANWSREREEPSLVSSSSLCSSRKQILNSKKNFVNIRNFEISTSLSLTNWQK